MSSLDIEVNAIASGKPCCDAGKTCERGAEEADPSDCGARERLTVEELAAMGGFHSTIPWRPLSGMESSPSHGPGKIPCAGRGQSEAAGSKRVLRDVPDARTVTDFQQQDLATTRLFHDLGTYAPHRGVVLDLEEPEVEYVAIKRRDLNRVLPHSSEDPFVVHEAFLGGTSRSTGADIVICVTRPLSRIFQAYEEGEFCDFRERDFDGHEDVKDILNRGYLAANALKFIIEEYFDAVGQSARGTLNHIDGTIRPKVRLADLNPNPVCAVTCPDVIGRGLITWHRDAAGGGFIQDAADAFNGTTDLWDRLCIVLDVAAIIIHESSHLPLGSELRAMSLEGYFRFEAQNRLRIAEGDFCGQTEWGCGTNTDAGDCADWVELLRDVDGSLCA